VETPADRDQPRVLLIDCEVDSRFDTRSMLVASGWVVSEASTATVAIEMAQHVQPDVIVLDLGVSDGFGHGMLADLTSSVDAEGIPIVVLSGMEVSAGGRLLREGPRTMFRSHVPLTSSTPGCCRRAGSPATAASCN